MNALKKYDLSYSLKGDKILAGVDEAGRGPLAGPVVAAAVIFTNDKYHEMINDSKKLSETKRKILFDWIIENCSSYGIGIVDQKEIDVINILQASLKAMRIAVDKIVPQPEIILIDGNKSFYHNSETHPVIKGDSKSFAIAAASILAKVTRDRLMKEFALEYPKYGWEHNKGYATKKHIAAIQKFGITELHRISFLRNILTSTQQEIDFRK